MTLSEEYKGYALAVTSYITQAIGSIGSKMLINATSAEATSVLWFVFGTAMSWGILCCRRGGVNWQSLRRNADVYLQVGLVMAVGTLGWFVGLQLAGPGIVAFIQQMTAVIGVLLGALVLGERIGPVDGLGATLAILGALTISYRSGELIALGIAATLLNAFGLAMQSFLVKRHVQRIDNFEVLAVRSAVALVATSIFFFTSGKQCPPVALMPDFALWTAVGYVAFNLLLYFSLGHADLAKVAALSVITPPTAMLGAYWVFGTVPSTPQIFGGALILVGVSLILLQPLLRSQSFIQKL